MSVQVVMSFDDHLSCCSQAAARAAGRRARDNVWCPCDHGTDIGYNSDDDGIILDSPQQAGQTPATQQAQTATRPGSSHANQQPTAPVMHQGSMSNAAAGAEKIQDRQIALGVGQSPSELVSLAKQQQPQQQQQLNDQQRLRADPACTSCSGMPAVQNSGDSDLVDLTADDVDMMLAPGPTSKRMRLLQSS